MKRFNIQQLALFIMLLIFSSLGAQNQISGVIYYHDNDSNPLPNVVVELYDSGDNLVATTTTNDDGEYEFSNVPYGEYYILSSSTQNFGTLNLIDPSIVLQYLNGTYNLNDFEFVAADVNGNGVVNGGDYNKLMKKILGKKNSFEEEWAFEEVEIDFTARDFEEEVEHWGTSTGDVEGIWMPGGRDLDFLVEYQLPTDLNETEIELEIGSSYKDLISGFNLNLVYPTNLIEITDVTGPDENFLFNLDKNTGVLNVIWLDENIRAGNTFRGETLFTVKVKQIQNSTQIEEGVFSLLEGGMMLDSRSQPLEDVTINLPIISTITAISNEIDPELEIDIVSYPNPASSNINFKLTSPDDNYANIYVYDLVGRLVIETNNMTIYKGTQLINMNIEKLPAGHYIYKLRMQGIDNITGRFYKTN